MCVRVVIAWLPQRLKSTFFEIIFFILGLFRRSSTRKFFHKILILAFEEANYGFFPYFSSLWAHLSLYETRRRQVNFKIGTWWYILMHGQTDTNTHCSKLILKMQIVSTIFFLIRLCKTKFTFTYIDNTRYSFLINVSHFWK